MKRSILMSLCLLSISAMAEIKPITSGTEEETVANLANSIISVTNLRTSEKAFKLVTLDSKLNGDIGSTGILLVGDEVGGEAGYDHGFKLSPSVDMMAVSSVQAQDDKLLVTFFNNDGVKKQRSLKFDVNSKTLVESVIGDVEKDCGEQVATNDVFQCLVEEHEKADKELNLAYGKAMRSQDAFGKKLLKKAQKAWITFRDAQCEAQADEMRGGSYEKVLRIGCLVGMTKEQTRILKAAVQGQK